MCMVGIVIVNDVNYGVAPLLLLPRSPGDEEHWQTMAGVKSSSPPALTVACCKPGGPMTRAQRRGSMPDGQQGKK